MRQKLIDCINNTVDEFQCLDAAIIADDIIANVLSKEPETIELSVKEVAEKLDIDPSKLKIVDK